MNPRVLRGRLLSGPVNPIWPHCDRLIWPHPSLTAEAPTAETATAPPSGSYAAIASARE